MAARRKLSAAWTVFGALAPLWMFSPGPGTLDNPVVDDGRVFATFHTFSESRLYALALATGKEQWHRPIEMTGILVAARGRLLFMDRDKSLHSIDAATGRDLWTAPVFFFLAAGDSGIYVLDSDRRLAILDDSTGRVARRTGVRGDELTATSSILAFIGRDRVYLQDGSALHALNVVSGRPLWTYKTTSPAQAEDNGTVYFTTNVLTMLDAATGALRGELPLRNFKLAPYGGLAVTRPHGLLAGFSGSAHNALCAVQPQTGRSMWCSDWNFEYFGAPAHRRRHSPATLYAFPATSSPAGAGAS